MADETTTITTAAADAAANTVPKAVPKAQDPKIAAARAKVGEAVAAFRVSQEAAKAAKAAADEAARTAGQTELQQIDEARAKLIADGETAKTEIANERKALAIERRNVAAAKLGILPKALKWVPEVDPATAEGAAALEAWCRENPELLDAKPSAEYVAPPIAPASKTAQLLSGAIKHPFLTADTLRKRIAAL